MKDTKRKFRFIWYLITHRDERFWQALRNWSGEDKIIAEFTGKQEDTFYW